MCYSIVGAGHNSEGGIPRLRPAVEELCHELGLQVLPQNNPGRVHISLPPSGNQVRRSEVRIAPQTASNLQTSAQQQRPVSSGGSLSYTPVGSVGGTAPYYISCAASTCTAPDAATARYIFARFGGREPVPASSGCGRTAGWGGGYSDVLVAFDHFGYMRNCWHHFDKNDSQVFFSSEGNTRNYRPLLFILFKYRVALLGDYVCIRHINSHSWKAGLIHPLLH